MNNFCSIFSQLLQLFPRYEFQKLVKHTQAERHDRGFTCWGQFVGMLFCQQGRAHSLREITNGLRSCEGKLKHLGILAPHRFALAGRTASIALNNAIYCAVLLAVFSFIFVSLPFLCPSFSRIAILPD
jgi:hypothetical protein